MLFSFLFCKWERKHCTIFQWGGAENAINKGDGWYNLYRIKLEALCFIWQKDGSTYTHSLGCFYFLPTKPIRCPSLKTNVCTALKCPCNKIFTASWIDPEWQQVKESLKTQWPSEQNCLYLLMMLQRYWP